MEIQSEYRDPRSPIRSPFSSRSYAQKTFDGLRTGKKARMDFPDSLTACFGRHLTQQLTDSSTNQLRDNLSYQEQLTTQQQNAEALYVLLRSA